jgi:aryl-alcohol dehydrogenase-like predicted oxidoreductase
VRIVRSYSAICPSALIRNLDNLCAREGSDERAAGGRNTAGKVTEAGQLQRLGRTGLRVSRVGLGLAALGRPGYISVGHGEDLRGRTDVAAMERNAHRVLDEAFAAGVRYLDAARSYGLAEAFLASWLRERRLQPSEVTVGSKWGYTYTAGWRVDAAEPEVKDLSAATLRRQLAESRALVGPHLRLYQIHSATLESGVLEDAAVLDELARLREEGVAIGISVTGPAQAETILRALEIGGFDTVQATWNLIERSAGAALAEARAAGLGVIVKEAIANGRLAHRAADPLLAAAAEERGVSPDALALAAALAQPWADVVLSGATTAGQLRSNLAALDLDWGEELDHRLATLGEEPAEYWSARAALPWN